MAKLRDLIAAAEEAVAEKNEDRKASFQVSDPVIFPSPPKEKTEQVRLRMREKALSSHYFMAKVVLGYTKLRVEPHGELCSLLDFLEEHPEHNRSVVYMPRDTYKTTIATITRAILRGCKDPNTRGLILADTGLNAVRFGTEISNQFKFNSLLQWLFPNVVPENFATARWNNSEMVLKRDAPWREPTYDMMGAGGGIESRHYDWILADDLVTEKHIHSDAEMDKLTKWLPGLEPLLVNDVEGRIDFVGSRKKKGDPYEYIEKYYGATSDPGVEIGPHAVKRGALVIYSRSILEDGKIIFPYDKEKKSGISMDYIIRVRTHDPERYHAQLANSPKGTGLNWFKVEDLRYFNFERDTGLIEAVHDNKLIERISVWGLQRIILYDPSVAEKKTSSKQALHVVAKGSGPNRYLLESHVGHFLPDEAIELLYELDARWRPDFFSIEKRGFQGWVKYALNMISELRGLHYLPIVEYPPQGSERSQWSKKEHIRGLQPILSNHLMWFREDAEDDRAQQGKLELIEEIEFYPNVRWDDGIDALAQGLEYWPFSIDEAEIAAVKANEAAYLRSSLPERFQGLEFEPQVKQFSEQEFLAQLDATGYGFRDKRFNN